VSENEKEKEVREEEDSKEGQAKLEFRTADELLKERESSGYLAEEVSTLRDEMSYIREQIAMLEEKIDDVKSELNLSFVKDRLALIDNEIDNIKTELNAKMSEIRKELDKLWEIVYRLDNALTKLYQRREGRPRSGGRFPEPITDRQTAYIEDMVARVSELTGKSHEEILGKACRIAGVEMPGDRLENLTKRDASKVIDVLRSMVARAEAAGGSGDRRA